MQIKWLRRALNGLENIAGYIALDNPITALAIIDTIERVSDRLADPPSVAVMVAGTRELVIPSQLISACTASFAYCTTLKIGPT